MALFVLQAAWIACSGRYPMAFDEDFHLGIIRLYAHHLSPFFAGQPPGADAFGAVARDPSYLYQYLMSFPYRLISALTSDQTIQVLFLRAINVGLFAWGLALYRRLLLRTGAGRAVTHAVLLVFVLIPVVPLLAAQINYDNLLLSLVALALLWTVDVNAALRRGRRLEGRKLLQLSILCLLASVVKYAFLPVFAAIVLYLGLQCIRTFDGWHAFRSALTNAWQRLGRRTGWSLVAGLLLACVLFGQRYGVNVVRYHSPIPDCSKVLSVKACSAYGPWARNYHYTLLKAAPTHNPLTFAADWFYGMWLRLFFAVDGPGTNFQTRGPLLIPAISALVFTGVGVLSLLVYGRRVWRRYDASVLTLLFGMALVYMAALWLDEFHDYVHTGQPVAINGRYLLPVLLPLLLASALAINEWCRERIWLKPLISSVAVLSLVWGGGALTY
ncbi:MAG TPA: hypothetical protein VHA37_06440, partial [Candidatus Saccharimonadales bacterium]|nr:hypothetical protein [Candidatus Saccharimonadales bacterium]